jgi:hypothetical protein
LSSDDFKKDDPIDDPVFESYQYDNLEEYEKKLSSLRKSRSNTSSNVAVTEKKPEDTDENEFHVENEIELSEHVNAFEECHEIEPPYMHDDYEEEDNILQNDIDSSISKHPEPSENKENLSSLNSKSKVEESTPDEFSEIARFQEKSQEDFLYNPEIENNNTDEADEQEFSSILDLYDDDSYKSKVIQDELGEEEPVAGVNEIENELDEVNNDKNVIIDELDEVNNDNNIIVDELDKVKIEKTEDINFDENRKSIKKKIWSLKKQDKEISSEMSQAEEQANEFLGVISNEISKINSAVNFDDFGIEEEKNIKESIGVIDDADERTNEVEIDSSPVLENDEVDPISLEKEEFVDQEKKHYNVIKENDSIKNEFGVLYEVIDENQDQFELEDDSIDEKFYGIFDNQEVEDPNQFIFKDEDIIHDFEKEDLLQESFIEEYSEVTEPEEFISTDEDLIDDVENVEAANENVIEEEPEEFISTDEDLIDDIENEEVVNENVIEEKPEEFISTDEDLIDEIENEEVANENVIEEKPEEFISTDEDLIDEIENEEVANENVIEEKPEEFISTDEDLIDEIENEEVANENVVEEKPEITEPEEFVSTDEDFIDDIENSEVANENVVEEKLEITEPEEFVSTDDDFIDDIENSEVANENVIEEKPEVTEFEEHKEELLKPIYITENEKIEEKIISNEKQVSSSKRSKKKKHKPKIIQLDEIGFFLENAKIEKIEDKKPSPIYQLEDVSIPFTSEELGINVEKSPASSSAGDVNLPEQVIKQKEKFYNEELSKFMVYNEPPNSPELKDSAKKDKILKEDYFESQELSKLMEPDPDPDPQVETVHKKEKTKQTVEKNKIFPVYGQEEFSSLKKEEEEEEEKSPKLYELADIPIPFTSKELGITNYIKTDDVKVFEQKMSLDKGLLSKLMEPIKEETKVIPEKKFKEKKQYESEENKENLLSKLMQEEGAPNEKEKRKILKRSQFIQNYHISDNKFDKLMQQEELSSTPSVKAKEQKIYKKKLFNEQYNQSENILSQMMQTGGLTFQNVGPGYLFQLEDVIFKVAPQKKVNGDKKEESVISSDKSVNIAEQQERDEKDYKKKLFNARYNQPVNILSQLMKPEEINFQKVDSENSLPLEDGILNATPQKKDYEQIKYESSNISEQLEPEEKDYKKKLFNARYNQSDNILSQMMETGGLTFQNVGPGYLFQLEDVIFNVRPQKKDYEKIKDESSNISDQQERDEKDHKKELFIARYNQSDNILSQMMETGGLTFQNVGPGYLFQLEDVIFNVRPQKKDYEKIKDESSNISDQQERDEKDHKKELFIARYNQSDNILSQMMETGGLTFQNVGPGYLFQLEDVIFNVPPQKKDYEKIKDESSNISDQQERDKKDHKKELFIARYYQPDDILSQMMETGGLTFQNVGPGYLFQLEDVIFNVPPRRLDIEGKKEQAENDHPPISQKTSLEKELEEKAKDEIAHDDIVSDIVGEKEKPEISVADVKTNELEDIDIEPNYATTEGISTKSEQIDSQDELTQETQKYDKEIGKPPKEIQKDEQSEYEFVHFPQESEIPEIVTLSDIIGKKDKADSDKYDIKSSGDKGLLSQLMETSLEDQESEINEIAFRENQSKSTDLNEDQVILSKLMESPREDEKFGIDEITTGEIKPEKIIQNKEEILAEKEKPDIEDDLKDINLDDITAEEIQNDYVSGKTFEASRDSIAEETMADDLEDIDIEPIYGKADGPKQESKEIVCETPANVTKEPQKTYPETAKPVQEISKIDHSKSETPEAYKKKPVEQEKIEPFFKEPEIVTLSDIIKKKDEEDSDQYDVKSSGDKGLFSQLMAPPQEDEKFGIEPQKIAQNEEEIAAEKKLEKLQEKEIDQDEILSEKDIVSETEKIEKSVPKETRDDLEDINLDDITAEEIQNDYVSGKIFEASRDSIAEETMADDLEDIDIEPIYGKADGLKQESKEIVSETLADVAKEPQKTHQETAKPVQEISKIDHSKSETPETYKKKPVEQEKIEPFFQAPEISEIVKVSDVIGKKTSDDSDQYDVKSSGDKGLLSAVMEPRGKEEKFGIDDLAPTETQSKNTGPSDGKNILSRLMETPGEEEKFGIDDLAPTETQSKNTGPSDGKNILSRLMESPVEEEKFGIDELASRKNQYVNINPNKENIFSILMQPGELTFQPVDIEGVKDKPQALYDKKPEKETENEIGQEEIISLSDIVGEKEKEEISFPEKTADDLEDISLDDIEAEEIQNDYVFGKKSITPMDSIVEETMADDLEDIDIEPIYGVSDVSSPGTKQKQVENETIPDKPEDDLSILSLSDIIDDGKKIESEDLEEIELSDIKSEPVSIKKEEEGKVKSLPGLVDKEKKVEVKKTDDQEVSNFGDIFGADKEQIEEKPKGLQSWVIQDDPGTLGDIFKHGKKDEAGISEKSVPVPIKEEKDLPETRTVKDDDEIEIISLSDIIGEDGKTSRPTGTSDDLEDIAIEPKYIKHKLGYRNQEEEVISLNDVLEERRKQEEEVTDDEFGDRINLLREKTFNDELKQLVDDIIEEDTVIAKTPKQIKSENYFLEEIPVKQKQFAGERKNIILKLHELYYRTLNLSDLNKVDHEFNPYNDEFEFYDTLTIDEIEGILLNQLKMLNYPHFALLNYDVDNKCYTPEINWIFDMNRENIVLGIKDKLYHNILNEKYGVMLKVRDIKEDKYFMKKFASERNISPIYFVSIQKLLKDSIDFLEITGKKELSRFHPHLILMLQLKDDTPMTNKITLYSLLKNKMSHLLYRLNDYFMSKFCNIDYRDLNSIFGYFEYIISNFSQHRNGVGTIVTIKNLENKELNYVIKYMVSRIESYLGPEAAILHIAKNKIIILTTVEFIDGVYDILNHVESHYRGYFRYDDFNSGDSFKFENILEKII